MSLTPKEMIMPLVVLDVHQKVEGNPDYQITMEDVKQWEKEYGSIPDGSFVVMRTDWSKRWPDQDRLQNKDRNGVAHYPGWSMDVLKYLFEQKKVTALASRKMFQLISPIPFLLYIECIATYFMARKQDAQR